MLTEYWLVLLVLLFLIPHQPFVVITVAFGSEQRPEQGNRVRNRDLSSLQMAYVPESLWPATPAPDLQNHWSPPFPPSQYVILGTSEPEFQRVILELSHLAAVCENTARITVLFPLLSWASTAIWQVLRPAPNSSRSLGNPWVPLLLIWPLQDFSNKFPALDLSVFKLVRMWLEWSLFSWPDNDILKHIHYI